MPDMIAFAAVIVLLPMGYFLLASPAFLLVGLDIPPVTQLLRGMFNVHVMAMIVAGVIATLSFAVAGRPGFAMGIGVIAAFAFFSFRWFVRQMDTQLRARDAGDAGAVRQLRRLHWGGMLCNAVLFAAVLGTIPYITVPPA